MSNRAYFESVRRRPRLHGLDGTWGGTVAFVLGFDAATSGGLLSGFREWLIVRLGDGNNLTWAALAERAVTESDPRETGDSGADELFALLDEFLAVKESPAGLVRIFDAYLEWLKGQSWYRSDML